MNPLSAAEQYPGTWLIAAEREMNRDSGAAFVMVTHDDRLAQVADCILLIKDRVLQNWIKPPICLRTGRC